MTRKKQMYLFLMVLSMMMLIGCGKSTSGTKEVTDGSIVVQVPEGSTVESLFDFYIYREYQLKWCSKWNNSCGKFGKRQLSSMEIRFSFSVSARKSPRCKCDILLEQA